MSSLIRRYSFIISALFFLACNEETVDEVSFGKILDDNSYTNSYEPVGVVETNDGGAVIITNVISDATNYPNISVIKVDEKGNWVNQFSAPDNYVFALGNVMQLDSIIYFVCMENTTFRANLASVNQDVSFLNFNPLIGSSFPLAAELINDQINLLHYDAEDKQSILSAFNTDGSLNNRVSYTIGEGSDADPIILNHYAQRKSRLPFEVGESASGGIYFNGLYNFSFSLVFSNFADSPAGVILGQGTNSGISSITPLSSGSYGVAGFQFEQNFIRPTTTLQESGVSSSIDYFDRDFVELKSNSIVEIIEYQLNNTNYIVAAAETEGRQIVLYFYDDSGLLVNTKYIGFLNAFTLGDIAVTTDNSLLLLGSTYVGGRFERIFIEKISEIQMNTLLK